MLLRHFHTVHAHVFEYLAPQDIVVLLSSCRTLRGDSEASGVALQKDPTTRHFFQRCLRDWCKTVPSFAWEYECTTDHAGDHTEHPCESDALLLLPASQRVALLSLAGLMASQLQDILYVARTGDVHSLYAVPFIFPIQITCEATPCQLCRALNTIRPQLGDTFFNDTQLVSEPGLHIDNLTISSETGTIVCAFCESVDHAIARYKAEADAYWETRGEELERLQHTWRDAGYDSSTDEFEDRTDAYEQSLQTKDAFYDYRLQDENLDESEIATLLLSDGRFPPLHHMAAKTKRVEQCVERSVAEGYREELCPHVYRPLRAFFDTNGFQFVRRVPTVKHDYTGTDNLPRSEIGNVEIMGGLAPHGFFAGVYLVELYNA